MFCGKLCGCSRLAVLDILSLFCWSLGYGVLECGWLNHGYGTPTLCRVFGAIVVCRARMGLARQSVVVVSF